MPSSATNRAIFLIDGFNLYHSVREAARVTGGRGTKWLDIWALCRSYLHLLPGRTELAGVYYFSALAHHIEDRDPDVTTRHRLFLDCLSSTGVTIKLTRFKRKLIRCEHCGQTMTRHEEKETDVAVAATLLEVLHSDHCDTAMIMSGDTDIAPAIRVAQRLFPEKTVGIAFPFGRKNRELARLVPVSFLIARGQYARYQFPPVVRVSGRSISKPDSW